MDNIKFSITIPAYKAKFLKEAIESCLSQTYGNYELIIVDDCSPDDLRSIVKPYLTDSRVRYYRNEKNCGAEHVVDNWNICLSYCTGDYVICMGDDDRLLPICLAEYANLVEQYPGIGLIHGWTEVIDENGDFLSLQQPRPLYETAMSVCWNRWNGRSQYIGDWCFRVDVLRQDGGFYKLPLAWASDDISAVRAASYNGVVNTQTLCFQYRENSKSITNTGEIKLKMDAILLEREWYKNFIKRSVPEGIETKYKILLKDQFDSYFKMKLKNNLVEDMVNDITRLFCWMYVRHKYGLKFKDIFISCKKAIEYKLRS